MKKLTIDQVHRAIDLLATQGIRLCFKADLPRESPFAYLCEPDEVDEEGARLFDACSEELVSALNLVIQQERGLCLA